jgi:hypothetical protein
VDKVQATLAKEQAPAEAVRVEVRDRVDPVDPVDPVDLVDPVEQADRVEQMEQVEQEERVEQPRQQRAMFRCGPRIPDSTYLWKKRTVR